MEEDQNPSEAIAAPPKERVFVPFKSLTQLVQIEVSMILRTACNSSLFTTVSVVLLNNFSTRGCSTDSALALWRSYSSWLTYSRGRAVIVRQRGKVADGKRLGV